MKVYKIGQVFEDAENFNPPKRVKYVKGKTCGDCVYVGVDIHKCINFCNGSNNTIFIATSEPLSDATE